LLILIIGVLLHAPASACIDLPGPKMRELDRLREQDPERAVALASKMLNELGTKGSALERAELDIIIAFARGSEGRAKDASGALTSARAELDQLPPGPDRRLVEERIATGAFGAADTELEYRTGLAEVDRLVGLAPPDSEEWVCLLIVRGDFHTELDRPDLAVGDQLVAHGTAQLHGWREASAMAAFTLATTYRRSGLWSDAENMINETIEYANEQHLSRLLAISYFTLGQILGDERKWDEAFDALATTQRLARAMGDTLTAAFATLPMCNALIESGKLHEARQRCGSEFKTFLSMGRSDLATDALIYGAEIDFAEKHYKAALASLNSVLQHHLDDVPARQKSRLYRERGDAESALGHFRAATEDLQRSQDAADAMALTDHVRTVAVLSGAYQAELLAAANKDLARDNLSQRQQLKSQALVRRLTTGLAVAAATVSAMLAYLLVLSNRHRRVIARQGTMLTTLTGNLSDNVLLLGTDRRLQFANRPMFDGPDAGRGDGIESVVPQEGLSQFSQEIERVYADRQTRDFDVSWLGPDGERRSYEQRATPIVIAGELLGVTVRATEVTARRRMEDQVRVQADILDRMSEGVFVAAMDGHILLTNPAMSALLGLDRRSLGSVYVRSFAPAAPDVALWPAATSSEPVSPFEAVILGSGGVEILVSIACSRTRFADADAVICVCRDISEQRRVERLIADSASSDAFDIGRNLHEGLAQELAGISYLLGSIAASIRGADAALGAGVKDVTENLSKAICSARKLAGLLSPLATVGGSLETALTGLAQETAQSMGVHVQFRPMLEGREIRGAVADQLFRIARDAIDYAVTQASPSTMAVSLAAMETAIELRVEWQASDSVCASVQRAGFTLAVIRYRARLVNGTSKYWVTPDGGTALTVIAPYD
jgi:PAS domain-containing protein